MEDTSTNYSTIVISVLMAVVVIVTVMMPIITATTQTATTTEIDNEGGGWLKLGYKEGGDYSFNVGYETITVDEVETEIFKVGEQTGDYENMICYADPQRTLFISGETWYLLTNGENPSVHRFTDTASVSNTSGTLTINDGSTEIYSGASPTWAYVPDANGVYGFFTDGGLNLEEGKPKVAVGSYAGVFAYNETVVGPNGYGNLGLTISGDYAEGEVIWVISSELDTLSALPTDTLEPAVLDLEPISLDPIDLGGSDSVGLMSANPSGGTQVGDLFYTFSGNTAEIIGYSSTTDWASLISLPDTVTYNGNTYTVTSIGTKAFLGAGANLIATSLPSGVTYIGNNAFENCTNLALTSLPSGVTSTGYGVFKGCTNLALTSLPEGWTNIPNRMFEGCTNLALTSLPAGITSIGVSSFEKCTNLALTSLPEGLTTLSQSSFTDCPNITLSKLPDTLTNVSETCFMRDVGITITVIPESVTTISGGAFGSCSGMDNLILLSSPTFANSIYTFNGTSIKEVLNLGTTEITITSYGLNADSVQDHVTALGYIAPTSIHETVIVEDTSLSATLLKLLPVFMALAVVIFIGYALLRPDSEFVRSLKSRF